MLNLLLTSQFIIVASLILVVLLQQNSSDDLSSLAGGGHGVISGKASTKFISRITFLLAFAFMINSLCLARLTIADLKKSGEIINSISAQPVENQDPVVPISQ